MYYRRQAFVFLALSTALWPIVLFAQSYQQSVTSLQADGIVGPGSFATLRLNEGVNRAEALKVILKSQPRFASSLSNITNAMPPISLFPDVDQRAWYAPYVELGFSSRIITGYPDGRLWPQAGVKVEEAAAMLARAFGEDTSSAPFTTSNSLPNQQGQWYTGAVSVINAKNAVGSPLRVGQNMSRGQLFDMVYRMRVAHGLSVATAPAPVQQQAYVQNNGGAQGSVQAVQDPSALQYVSSKPFAISIPSLGIVDLTVTHPTDAFSQDGLLSPLKNGVGHLFAYPGENSKVMIYGHSSGYPWDLSQYTKIFRGINKITVGARVYVTYNGKMLVYQVVSKKTIPAEDRSLFEPDSRGEELILYTCWPPDSITHRYTVTAVPVETIALR